MNIYLRLGQLILTDKKPHTEMKDCLKVDFHQRHIRKRTMNRIYLEMNRFIHE